MLRKELSGADLDNALALLKGNSVKADSQEAKNSIDRLGLGRAELEEIMKDKTDAEKERFYEETKKLI